jgi:hypothetical protein
VLTSINDEIGAVFTQSRAPDSEPKLTAIRAPAALAKTRATVANSPEPCSRTRAAHDQQVALVKEHGAH